MLSLTLYSYYIFRDMFLKGGVGKRVLQLSVITDTGKVVEDDLGVAFSRNILTALLPIIEGISLFSGRSVGDRIAKTYVVENDWLAY